MSKNSSGFCEARANLPVMLAFAWTSWYGLLVTIAGGIVTIGAALTVMSGGAKWLAQIARPSRPLVAIGGPSEDSYEYIDGKRVRVVGPPMPPSFLGALGKKVSSEELARLEEEYEKKLEAWRTLRVAYSIENKDSVPLRDLTTGIRKRDGGEEYTFREHSVQILSAGETAKVTEAYVPRKLHEGMTKPPRVWNFLYWARFERSGRRWEALYDPRTSKLTYKRLGRSDERENGGGGI